MAISPLKPGLETDATKLANASRKWLLGRLTYLQKNQTVAGAFNVEGYTNTKYFSIGEVFMYHYDPKLKMILPYYDTFPLCIPINMYGDGFLGLNLHYLPPKMRITFLNKLIEFANTGPGDSRIRMNISYGILKDAQHLNEYIPCVKRYLATHIRGRILRIHPHEWPHVVTMPFEAFQKASNSKVWSDSRRKINGTRVSK